MEEGDGKELEGVGLELERIDLEGEVGGNDVR